jgi:3-oxoadipate enol-lactonase
MPYFRSGDIKIHFEVSAPQGQQAQLLYISGTGDDLRKKPSVFDSPLTRFFQVAAYDQRGLGQSGKPDRPYSMANYADDALRLLDHLGWNRAQVMGVSFGGMVAQELAARHSDRIHRLVLCCTSSGGKGGSSYPLHNLDSLSEADRAQKLITISDLRCDELWIKGNRQLYADMIKDILAATRFASEERNHLIGARRQLDARRIHDAYERLPSINCPTLICGGRYDGLATPDNLKMLAAKLPEARLEFFEGGHSFLLQDEQAYPRIVEYLLSN